MRLCDSSATRRDNHPRSDKLEWCVYSAPHSIRRVIF